MSDTGGEPVECRRCGERLVEGLTPDEVVARGGRRIRFRRRTDFVMCERCFALYRIGDLRAGRVEPLSDEDLLSAGDATPAEHN